MNLEKPQISKITRSELARDCCHYFAYFLSTYPEEPFRKLWLESYSELELEQLLGNEAISKFLMGKFRSYDFISKYQPVNDMQLIKIRSAFLKSGIYMKDFTQRILEIFDGQKYMAKNHPNTHVSWDWPDCEDYLEDFNEVKLQLLKF